MIWLHNGDPSETTTTQSLIARLLDHCDASDLLVTTTGDVGEFADLPTDVTVYSCPADTPTKARKFLDDFQPETLIWIGGALRPALLRLVEKAGIRATLINARNDNLITKGVRWRPGAAKTAVSAFTAILTADGATATRLTRGGVSRAAISATGPILEEPIPLPHDQYEHTVMAEALGTRPVWYASDLPEAETLDIVAAHIAASRKNHRLLLLITPRDIGSGPQVATILRDAGLKVSVRSEGDDPVPEHQAYVTDLPDETGMWFRLSPLTFIGGSMRGGGTQSPFDPISLGSAVIHGTFKGPHERRFERLAQAEACREVRSPSELGITVGTLVSPEHTARMALAGWQEISHNADTFNRLIDMALSGAEVLP